TGRLPESKEKLMGAGPDVPSGVASGPTAVGSAFMLPPPVAAERLSPSARERVPQKILDNPEIPSLPASSARRIVSRQWATSRPASVWISAQRLALKFRPRSSAIFLEM